MACIRIVFDAPCTQLSIYNTIRQFVIIEIFRVAFRPWSLPHYSLKQYVTRDLAYEKIDPKL
jgi:hypothetical protein